MLLAGEFCAPCWSPDGKWLVFSIGWVGRMYKVKINGDSLTPLTDSSDSDCFDPDWSKTGLIAFCSNKNHPQAPHVLWTMQPDGSHKRDINHYRSGEGRMPSWSPEGSRIVFRRWDGDGYSKPVLAIVDSAGTNEVRLTADTAFDTEPAWSPDGQSIAFSTSETNLGTSSYRICVLNLEDGTRKYVTEGGAFAPAWSPDSKRLCFSYQVVEPVGDSFHQVSQRRGKLWVVDSDGKNAKPLAY